MNLLEKVPSEVWMVGNYLDEEVVICICIVKEIM